MASYRVNTISFLNDIRHSQEKLFNLMGESLLFQTNDSRMMDLAEEAFGRFPQVLVKPNNPLVLRLFLHGGSAASAPYESIKPVYHNQEHLFSIQSGMEGFALADLKDGFAFGFIEPELIQRREYLRINYIEALGYSMLGMAREYFAVHASCVVKDGRSIMLYGSPGLGKSSMALECVRRGYQILAEDAVFINTRGGGTRLWGAPWKLHLLPDADRFFPGLLENGKRVDYSGLTKIELDIEEFHPGATVTCATPGIILLLSRQVDMNIAVESIPFDTALETFEVVWPWKTGWTDRMERVSQELLKKDVFRLYMNGTPEAAVDALDGLLAELPVRFA